MRLIRSRSAEAAAHGAPPAAPGSSWFYYQCQTNLARGWRICANDWIMPLKEAETAVLATIEHHLLRPDVITEAIEGAPADLRPSADVHAAERAELERQLATTENELARLAAAVADGGRLETLLTALREREPRREQLRATLVALDAARHVASLDLGLMRKHLGALLDDWRGLLLGTWCWRGRPCGSSCPSGWCSRRS